MHCGSACVESLSDDCDRVCVAVIALNHQLDLQKPYVTPAHLF